MRPFQAAIICNDDFTYLDSVICALSEVEVTVFVSRVPHSDVQPGDWEAAARAAESYGAKVILGDWPDESSHRTATLEWARAEGIEYLLIPDTDEVISAKLLDSLHRIAAVGLSDCVYCTMDTYWKSPEYVIRPRELLMPPILIAPGCVEHVYRRRYSGLRPLALSAEHGVMHHLSYSGPDSRIRRKTETWSHKDEIVPNWHRDVWDSWDKDRTMQNLHPTHPEAYGCAERIIVPGELALAWSKYLQASEGSDPLHTPEPARATPDHKVSVIIPLYGGELDLRLCLDSLARCQGEFHEVIVVDDASPDKAAEVTAEYPFVRLVRHPENRGFGASCNSGAREATGDALLFLNSDTVVPPLSISLLAQSLQKTGTIGAVGPLSNSVGHFQRIATTYSAIEHLDLFAEDIRICGKSDVDVDMLTGFCLMIPRKVWDEIGEFDERFRVGMFEDNDYCHRLRREGYRLMMNRRAFVHHKGNASLDRHSEDKARLFQENERRFFAKWPRDLESGFASQLAGITPERIQFREERRPERLQEANEALCKQANISLCMIVRDEERVLADCLRSAAPFFSQIVVVDTGSKDQTVEIANSFGAEVHEMEWPDSFAAARNHSLQFATGDWVCWLDADDTLPYSSGESILNAVTTIPDHIGGLVLPVRFVNDDPEFGTQVDHVKVFRNRLGLQFEGRIHEQILPSIRDKGLEVVRINAEVLHSGYDTSEEGQAKKRDRDSKLLLLDLEDRPDHPFVLFNLGMTAHYNGEHEDAIKWLARSVEVAHSGESHIRKAYALWATSLREMRQMESALEVVEDGLKSVGDDPELLFHLAILQTHFRELAKAKASYQKVLTLDASSYFSSVDSGILGYKTLHNLGAVCVELGELAEAKHYFEQAAASNPRFLTSVFELFRLCLRTKDFPTAQRCIDQVIAAEGMSANVAAMRRDLSQLS